MKNPISCFLAVFRGSLKAERVNMNSGNMKSRCVRVEGVNLWGGCDEDLKMCRSLCVLFTNKVVNAPKTQN